MSITFEGLCRAFLRSASAAAKAEREEHARLEAKRRQKEQRDVEWREEQSRRRTRKSVAAALEARRERQEAREAVWRTEAERLAAIDIEAQAEAKRALAEQQEQERLDFIASNIMRQQMKRR